MRNLEIKIAVTADRLAKLEAKVRLAGHPVVSLHQVDTYFAVPSGRLKLRETTDAAGEEVADLIAYQRPDVPGARWSDYERLSLTSLAGSNLKAMLAATIGVTTVVAKQRTVAIRGRSRIHLDRVDELGCFLEIETVAGDGDDGDDDAGIDQELAATLEWLGFDLATAEPIRGSYAELRRNQERQG